MGFSLSHLLVVLVIIVLLFGTGKLTNIGADLGSAIKGFKKAIGDDESDKDKKNPPDADKPKSE